MKRRCLTRGCPQLITSGSRCAVHRAERERARNARRPAELALYSSGAWQRLRRAVVQSASGCHWCRRSGVRLSADHIVTVRTAPHLALDPSNVVASCGSCQLARQYQPVEADDEALLVARPHP
jgi:5-methylcytosine-specific restriction endonuclease McrA